MAQAHPFAMPDADPKAFQQTSDLHRKFFWHAS